MNICFLSGKIIHEIKFDFIINNKSLKNKNISIFYFNIKIKNNSIIKIKAYNEEADYCYKNLNKNDVIFLEGIINNKYEIIINNIIKIN